MRVVLALAVTTSGLAFAQTPDQSHEHSHSAMKAGVPGDAPIQIAINPEARVSVSRGDELPPPVACGQPLELPVKIANQGFVTASLEARRVDSVPDGARVEFSSEPLTGAREEYRILRLTLQQPGVVDVTVSFRAKNDIPDLGGRDRVHFMARCHEST